MMLMLGAWQARQNIKAVIPARARRTNLQAPGVVQGVLHVVARGLDWLQHRRRVAPL